jgi:hypothetical protein
MTWTPTTPGSRMWIASQFPRRPVYHRYLMRKHQMQLAPPSEEEKRDAILILKDPYEDELSEEALRILDEADALASE